MKTVYLLGAGFTRALNDKAPLNNDVMEKIDFSKFEETSQIRKEAGKDIEYLLTLLDLKIAKASAELEKLQEIKKNINRQIHDIFDIDKLCRMNSNKQLLDQFVQSIPNDSHIISLNYDCVLDQGLYWNGVWEPCCGYRGKSEYKDCSCKTKPNHKNIILLKPHGSINFYLRKSINTNEPGEYPQIDLSDNIFPERSSNFNGRDDNDEPYIATMSYDKQYKNGMFMFWGKAIKALKEADRLVVIGCSLRNEDAFLRYALYNFGARKDADKLIVEVVSQSDLSCETVKSNIEKVIVKHVKYDFVLYPGGLKEFVINSVCV
jgi:hypothetical protein